MKNKGFSLVELIVVIAIMAILVGVAVPVYTSYIEKSQISKDKQTVDEVAHALQVYYTANVASNPDGLAGYVVLTKKGTNSYADEVGAAAMEAIFGANWATDLSLAYDGWTDDGLLNYVLQNAASAEVVAGSTFLNDATTEGMMNTVTKLTGIVSDTIVGSDMTVAFDRLETLLGEDSDVVKTLNDLKMDQNDPAFSTVVSNLLVGHFADSMATSPDAPLTFLCATYASAYAYSQTEGGNDDLVKELDKYMEDLTYKKVSSPDFGDQLNEDLGEMASFNAFVASDYCNDGTVDDDAQAFLAMMGAVSEISGTIKDKDALADSQMYSSSAVASQVDNYATAIKAVASGIDVSALNNVEAGSVVIFFTADGQISVIPGTVYSK